MFVIKPLKIEWMWSRVNSIAVEFSRTNLLHFTIVVFHIVLVCMPTN